MFRKSTGIFCALALSFATVAFAQTDAALTASVKTKLAADDMVKASSVNVTTVDHVVTLAGVVGSKAAKDRAIDIARDTSGVASVVDRITVRDVAATTGKSTAEKAAGGVEKGAEKSADAVGTAAHKSAGAVDKSKDKVGEAAEKTGEALGTAAKETGKAVESAGKKTGAVVSDAAITSEVKTKLLGNGKTPGLKIDVDTDNGVVTLSGDVPDATAHTTALRLARGTMGVKRVVDKLTVAGK